MAVQDATLPDIVADSQLSVSGHPKSGIFPVDAESGLSVRGEAVVSVSFSPDFGLSVGYDIVNIYFHAELNATGDIKPISIKAQNGSARLDATGDLSVSGTSVVNGSVSFDVDGELSVSKEIYVNARMAPLKVFTSLYVGEPSELRPDARFVFVTPLIDYRDECEMNSSLFASRRRLWNKERL